MPRSWFAFWGVLGWVGGVGIQRLASPLDMAEDAGVVLLLYAAAVPLIAALTIPLYAYHGLSGSYRVVAAAWLALPGMLCDSVALFVGGAMDPGLSRATIAGWGSSQLWTYAVVLGVAALADGGRRRWGPAG